MVTTPKDSNRPRYVAKFGPVAAFGVQQPFSMWSDTAWQRAAVAAVDQFSPESSAHRPITLARVMYDDAFLHVRFDVSDRFVIAHAKANQDAVFKDSCVEFFVQPHGNGGYFNFEFNCGGTMLASFIEDPVRTADGFRKFQRIDSALLDQMAISHTLPKRIDVEITEPIDWKLSASIPLALLQHYAGDVKPQPGDAWRCNFYKCAEANSHPHWAAWSPIGSELNFHLPDRFGELFFER